MPRRRWRHPFAFLLLTLVLGLASRHFSHYLPWWLAKNAGDILYATMIFWLLACLRPPLKTPKAAMLALAICVVIEFAKFIQVPWLVAVRHQEWGRLVLGSGFHVSNLICYGVGVCLGALWEQGIDGICRGRRRSDERF